MVAFTKTISNSVNVFGGSPSSKWGSVTWGSFQWGEGTNNTLWDFNKLITNSQSFSDATYKSFSLLWSESLAVTENSYREELIDSAGYHYIFTGPAINAENRSDTGWTDTDAGDVATWTCQAAGSTTWSEV